MRFGGHRLPVGTAGGRWHARFLIAMTGTDGHRALPSRADTDPDFTLAPVLLAVGVDGTPLDWLRAAAECMIPAARATADEVGG